jgi:hypothetical protein
MRTVDKNGIAIEQCEGCRGIFLDRGELEQIAGAESTYYGNFAPAYQPPPPYQAGHAPTAPYGHSDSPKPYRGHSDSPRPYRGGYGHPDSPRPHGHGGRRRSFLENLFD